MVSSKHHAALHSPPSDSDKDVDPKESSRARKTAKSHTKSIPKPVKRHSTASTGSAHDHDDLDGRMHKRVWKACERCRQKKTKCDGESPCKRCKEDGHVCLAGTRKKQEFKHLPKGYAEVLENMTMVLTATVEKMFLMLQHADAWTQGDIERNASGRPVIHDICAKLGCIRQSLEMPATFATTEADFAQLRDELMEQNGALPDEDEGSNPMDGAPVQKSAAMERHDSSASEASILSRDMDQDLYAQQQQQLHQQSKPHNASFPGAKYLQNIAAQYTSAPANLQVLTSSFPSQQYPTPMMSSPASTDTPLSPMLPFTDLDAYDPFPQSAPGASNPLSPISMSAQYTSWNSADTTLFSTPVGNADFDASASSSSAMDCTMDGGLSQRFPPHLSLPLQPGSRPMSMPSNLSMMQLRAVQAFARQGLPVLGSNDGTVRPTQLEVGGGGGYWSGGSGMFT